MDAMPVSELFAAQVQLAGRPLSLELIQLTMAACQLMAVDRNLSPEDAVGDVMQVYDCVAELMEKRQHSPKNLSVRFSPCTRG